MLLLKSFMLGWGVEEKGGDGEAKILFIVNRSRLLVNPFTLKVASSRIAL